MLEGQASGPIVPLREASRKWVLEDVFYVRVPGAAGLGRPSDADIVEFRLQGFDIGDVTSRG